MNNDTPKVSGEDTHGYPRSSVDSQDDEDFPAFRGWTGWGDRVEPVAPDEPYEFDYAGESGLPLRPGPGQPGYPAGPGYAPEADYPRDLTYAPGMSYAPDYGYPRELGFAEDPGYGGEPPEPTLVPPMEQLPDSDELAFPLAGFRAPEPAPAAELDEEPESVAPTAPLQVIPAPVALLPPDEELAWQESSAWHEGSAWQEDGQAALEPLPRAPEPYAPEPYAPEPYAPEPVGPEPEYTRETSDSLTSESLLHGRRAAPGSGWRRSVYRATGGLLRFGESAAEMRRRDLINRVRTPVAGGHHRIAVLSLKGGVGKTTTAVGLGATLATLRGDRVIAVDANPDRGTLSDKVRLETAATIRDLLNERGQVGRYADVRAFTSQAPSRLEVLASDRDPAVSVAFGAEDYSDIAQVLEHFYSICITDCGTGLLHSAMSGVLALADQIILVSSPSVDGARSASATLDWLEAHGCGDLVRNGVVVLSAIRPKSKSTVDIDRLEHHFAARCRAVARIPYDPHLEEGAEIELELLGSDTAEAYLSLAAVVGDGLAWSRRRGG
jgi:MinD-like ATPase involved in chromosome partitioning or flagellar assembly